MTKKENKENKKNQQLINKLTFILIFFLTISTALNLILITKVKTHKDEVYLEHYSRLLNLLIVDMCAKYPDKEKNLLFTCELDNYQLLDNDYVKITYKKHIIDGVTLEPTGETVIEDRWIWPHGEPDNPEWQSRPSSVKE